MRIRNSARALIINENNEILLQKFDFYFTGKMKVLWVTPGGGVEDGENFAQAIERELFEELGISIKIKDESIFTLDIPFDGNNGRFISHEVYYLVLVSKTISITFKNMTANEKNTFHTVKWWSLEELRKTNEEFEPRSQILNILEYHKNI